MTTAKPTQKPLTISMTLERETKGTFVYAGPDDGPIKSLYIAKSAYPQGAPDKIAVVVATQTTRPASGSARPRSTEGDSE